MGDAERALDVLLDEEDRDALAVDARHDRGDLIDDARRQAEERLVDHQQPRARHETAGDGHHLLLAARQACGRAGWRATRSAGTAR